MGRRADMRVDSQNATPVEEVRDGADRGSGCARRAAGAGSGADARPALSDRGRLRFPCPGADCAEWRQAVLGLRLWLADLEAGMHDDRASPRNRAWLAPVVLHEAHALAR